MPVQFMYYNCAAALVAQQEHAGDGGGISDHVRTLQEVAALLD